MHIVEVDYDYEPSTFYPGEAFVVFTDKDSDRILGCANMYCDFTVDAVQYDIPNFEAYGYGAAIINYLINSSENVTIIGETTKDSYRFWDKMAASFTEESAYTTSFKITKEDFMNTKYYKPREN